MQCLCRKRYSVNGENEKICKMGGHGLGDMEKFILLLVLAFFLPVSGAPC